MCHARLVAPSNRVTLARLHAFACRAESPYLIQGADPAAWRRRLKAAIPRFVRVLSDEKTVDAGRRWFGVLIGAFGGHFGGDDWQELKEAIPTAEQGSITHLLSRVTNEAEVREALSRVRLAECDDLAKTIVAKAWLFLDEPGKAAATLADAAKEDPHVSFWLAMALSGSQPREAAMLAKAAFQAARRPDTLFLLCRLLTATDARKEALVALADHRDLVGGDARLRLLRASLLALQGDLQSARMDWLAVLEAGSDKIGMWRAAASLVDAARSGEMVDLKSMFDVVSRREALLYAAARLNWNGLDEDALRWAEVAAGPELDILGRYVAVRYADPRWPRGQTVVALRRIAKRHRAAAVSLLATFLGSKNVVTTELPSETGSVLGLMDWSASIADLAMKVDFVPGYYPRLRDLVAPHVDRLLGDDGALWKLRDNITATLTSDVRPEAWTRGLRGPVSAELLHARLRAATDVSVKIEGSAVAKTIDVDLALVSLTVSSIQHSLQQITLDGLSDVPVLRVRGRELPEEAFGGILAGLVKLGPVSQRAGEIVVALREDSSEQVDDTDD